MQLTGREIVERGIITNIDEENGIQQQGIDLRVIGNRKLSGVGCIPLFGKTKLPNYSPVEMEVEPERSYWRLEPGYYEITFEEGCKIPSNLAMTLIQRSSLLRCGGIIRSSQFDAGFSTDHMGSFMEILHPVEIEYQARIAQTIVVETAEVRQEDLYHGQWAEQQNVVQRGRF